MAELVKLVRRWYVTMGMGLGRRTMGMGEDISSERVREGGEVKRKRGQTEERSEGREVRRKTGQRMSEKKEKRFRNKVAQYIQAHLPLPITRALARAGEAACPTTGEWPSVLSCRSSET